MDNLTEHEREVDTFYALFVGDWGKNLAGQARCGVCGTAMEPNEEVVVRHLAKNPDCGSKYWR